MKIFFNSIGLHLPQVNYNPADFYIKTLAIIPSKKEESRLIVEVIYKRYYISPKASTASANESF
jgi:hypothetical protein